MTLRRVTSTGGTVEAAAAELLDRARAHFLDAGRVGASSPVAWSCSVAAGLALLEAVDVLAGAAAVVTGLGAYYSRHGCAPWDDHGPAPTVLGRDCLLTEAEFERLTAGQRRHYLRLLDAAS